MSHFSNYLPSSLSPIKYNRSTRIPESSLFNHTTDVLLSDIVDDTRLRDSGADFEKKRSDDARRDTKSREPKMAGAGKDSERSHGFNDAVERPPRRQSNARPAKGGQQEGPPARLPRNATRRATVAVPGEVRPGILRKKSKGDDVNKHRTRRIPNQEGGGHRTSREDSDEKPQDTTERPNREDKAAWNRNDSKDDGQDEDSPSTTEKQERHKEQQQLSLSVPKLEYGSPPVREAPSPERLVKSAIVTQQAADAKVPHPRRRHQALSSDRHIDKRSERGAAVGNLQGQTPANKEEEERRRGSDMSDWVVPEQVRKQQHWGGARPDAPPPTKDDLKVAGRQGRSSTSSSSSSSTSDSSSSPHRLRKEQSGESFSRGLQFHSVTSY